MTGVVLRCANCGTTQNAQGECQACHEQNVKFYCTRHSPGRWLKTPVCDQCGAEYGKDPPPARKEWRPRTPDWRRRPPARAERTEPLRRREPWGRPASDLPPDVVTTDTRRTIERLLREYSMRRTRPREGVEIDRGASAIAGGCLRAILVAFLLMMFIMFMLPYLGGMLLLY